MPPEKLLWRLASVVIRGRFFKQLLVGVLPAGGKLASLVSITSILHILPRGASLPTAGSIPLFGVLPAGGKLAPPSNITGRGGVLVKE